MKPGKINSVRNLKRPGSRRADEFQRVDVDKQRRKKKKKKGRVDNK